MVVSINLNKPLDSKLVDNGHIQLIEYKSLPTICFNCGKCGNVSNNCPDLNATSIVEELIAPPKLESSRITLKSPTDLPHVETTWTSIPTKHDTILAQQPKSNQKSKGKATASPKHHLAVSVRKSLQVTLSNLPMTSRNNNRTSSSITHIVTPEI
ncbi:hypothetical protein V6N11_082939 [Hibiscus sabdariffa]|uniref:CCHC-type domain-containing protein n=1 Tax=Hibiscus sabdariffa TaxID=183260 RepID=A0ABR2QKF0_9ROSI